MSWQLRIAVAALVFGAGAGLGHQLTELKWLRLERDRAQAAAEDERRANLRADVAARSYEAGKAQARARVITITRELEHEIEIRPDWAGTAVPDGVRDALSRAAAEAGAAGAAGAMPGPDGQAGGNER